MRKWSRNAAPNRRSARYSPRVMPVGTRAVQDRPGRRGRSAGCPGTCAGTTGRAARPRWAKNPRAPREPNSTSHARQTDANDMSLRLRLDAQLLEQADEPRVRGLVVDDEAGVHVDRAAGRVHRRPWRRGRPGWRARSNRATSWPSRWRAQAAVRPLTPAPTTATLIGGRPPSARSSSACCMPPRASLAIFSKRAARERLRPGASSRSGGCRRCSRCACRSGSARSGSRRPRRRWSPRR